jgi:uncharacterized protein YdeI (YjbR/CyaY-like superfamily)
MTSRNPRPRFFKSQEEFRTWLEKNHSRKRELWVGFKKKGSRQPSLTWPESVDQALCFGWIDGIRKSRDESSYVIRFSPRKHSSIWSVVNTKRFRVLHRKGLIHESGEEAFGRRDPQNTQKYSFERTHVSLSREFTSLLRANEEACLFFRNQIPSYRKAAVWWVMSAKQESTRRRRLTRLISDSERRRFIPPMRGLKSKPRHPS